MIKECLPKVRIKPLKMSYAGQNIIPCFLTFCSSDQSLLSFLNFNILVFLLFIVCLYKFMQAKIIKHYRRLINYACLQVLVNNNAYMAKQLCYHKLQSKHLKSICSSV